MTRNGRPGTAGVAGGDIPRGLAKLLTAYRGNLSLAEAARRSGLSEARWEEVETAAVHGGSGSSTPSISPQTVAAMCVAVGADVATGLKLAGHEPHDYEYLLTSPPRILHVRSPRAPSIVSCRVVADAVARPAGDPRPMIVSAFRDVAEANRRLAETLTEDPPDERADYWSGYADALRALAEEQTTFADMEAPYGP